MSFMDKLRAHDAETLRIIIVTDIICGTLIVVTFLIWGVL